MTVVVAGVNDAVKDAGASDEKARKAAEPLTQHDQRFANIDTDLAVLNWVLGFTLVGVVTLIAKVFTA